MRVLFLFLSLVATPAFAEWSSKGEIALESRIFENDDVASTVDHGLAFAPRLDGGFKSRPFQSKYRLVGRVDQADASRRQMIVEELWLGLKTRKLRFRVGAQKLNWTATEAFHPSDIINSRNLDSNIENAEKIGEPMVMASYKIFNGRLAAFLMPMYMDPLLPASSSRLSFIPAGGSVGKSLWLERDGNFSNDEFGVQWGLRLTQSLSFMDVGVHFVQHQDRNQPFLAFDGSSYRPIYLPVSQLGSTLQVPVSGLMVKLESAYRMFEVPTTPTSLGTITRSNHGFVALGLEYALAHDSGSETTLLAEGQAIVGVSHPERRKLSSFQQDLLFGVRHSWNDEVSRQAMISTIWDTERTQEFLLNIDYSQRLSDVWGLKVGIRKIHAPPESAIPVGLQGLDKANQIFLNLTRYF